MHLWHGDGHGRDDGAVHVCTDVGRLEINLSYKLHYLREVGFLADMRTLVMIAGRPEIPKVLPISVSLVL